MPRKSTRRLASERDEQRVVSLVTPDVVATLGDKYADLVRSNASRLREFVNADDYLRRVVDDVQQQIHDEFIDTDWPKCPLHQRHPLWFREGRWWCDEAGVSVAQLGKLGGAAR